MQTDLQPDAAVEEAARFLAATPPHDRPKPLVPAMRSMFNISALGVCEAIRLSHRLREVRDAS